MQFSTNSRRLDGRFAAERSSNGTVGAENRNGTLDGGPSSHARASKTGQDIEYHGKARIPRLFKTTHETLDASVVAGGNAGNGVKTLAGQRRSLLDAVGDVHDSWDGVGEVEREEATHNTDEEVEVGDGGGEEEGDDPVDWAENEPQDLALLGDDRGKVENLLEDLEVDGLHADVEIEDNSDEACNQAQDVADGLQAVREHDLTDVGGGVLAVLGVDLRKLLAINVLSV